MGYKERIVVLPPWAITNKFPAFYDIDSSTAIEQTGKIYGAMRDLQLDYNKFAIEINDSVNNFMNSVNKDQDEFIKSINKLVHDYIIMLDNKIKLQDLEIKRAVDFMKTNLIKSIENTLNEMIENGDLDKTILNVFNGLYNKVNEIDSRVNKLESIIPYNQYNATTETLEIKNIGGRMKNE